MLRPVRLTRILGNLLALLVSLLGIGVYRAVADCPEFRGELDPDPNVLWTFKDSIAACPAGDSLIWGTNPHKPSQLRILVSYFDNNCDPKVAVPPESIYVVTENYSGNAKANDQPKVYADDSTDAGGVARVTVRSLSGAGRIKFRVFVSGVEQGGYSLPYVRTTDTNADGRTTSGDATSMADLNYNGVSGELADLSVLGNHVEHWHRHALFGTPVRRTNLTGNYGNGRIDWEPNQQRIAYSAHITAYYKCRILHIPSDPADGNTPTLFTWDGGDSNDYNPSWSPRGHEIAFDRNDVIIYRKGLPGSADTTKAPVVMIDGAGGYVTIPAYSPNGRTVAYCRYITTGSAHINIYTVTLPDGTPQQLTRSKTAFDYSPRWSPDGEWIYFMRYEGLSSIASLWRVKSDGTDSTEVYAPSGVSAVRPAPTPDGEIIVAQREGPSSGYGIIHTLEADVTTPAAVPNYAGYAVATPYALYQVPSPDGTKVAFLAPPIGGGYYQLWATRRNMDLPPTITSIGDRVVEQGSTLSFTVSASDPESDAVTRAAFYLESGMSFTPSTGAFSWTPGGGTAGNSYWVKFRATVPSGGTASEVVKISVIEPGFRSLPLASIQPQIEGIGGNPSTSGFVLMAPQSWGRTVELRVYDARGRLVGREHGKAGVPLVWKGNDLSGMRATPGLYFYTLRGPQDVSRGKWVLLR